LPEIAIIKARDKLEEKMMNTKEIRVILITLFLTGSILFSACGGHHHQR